MSDQQPIQPTGITEESPGVKSSKRIAGLTMVGLGALVLLILGVWSLFYKAADAETAMSCGIALCSIGAGLLGVTIFEGFFKKT